MEKLIVYLVCEHQYSNENEPLAIFSTRKLAEKFRKKVVGKRIFLYKDAELYYPIVEMELDKDE
jgi:hypothetical protein